MSFFFKQKTDYKFCLSVVGSEMCLIDRLLQLSVARSPAGFVFLFFLFFLVLSAKVSIILCFFLAYWV